MLIGVGAFAIVNAIRRTRAAAKQSIAKQTGGTLPAGHVRLLLSGLALSMDNLVVGFALGTYHTSIAVDAITIGVVSVALSLIGLELGGRLGKSAGERGEQLAGLMLISVGLAIAAGALS